MPPSPDKPLTERDRLRALAATHAWVGAAELPLSAGQAHTADLRAAVTIKADTKVHIVDAYCGRCRNTWESVIGQACAARDPRESEHLRGGRPGERKKRGRQPRRTAPPADLAS